MSIDGSFNLQSELRRFLARCPNLKSNPRLISLVVKGDEVTEDEVVSTVAELLLNDKYTIPLLGCFRPIAGKIVNKAVDLLQLVPGLKVNLDDSRMDIDDDDDDNPYLIDGYVRSGRSLKLHETACLAFCRALDLAPYLLRLVLRYFKFSPSPFQRLLDANSVSQLIAEDGAQLLDVVRVSFRLLLVEPQVFSELWDWSSFLDLEQQSTELVLGKDNEVINVGLDIRWCAIQILSITLKISDKTSVKFGLDAEKALASFLRWEEFCQDVSLEKAGWYLDKNLLEMGKLVDTDVEFSGDSCLWSSNTGPLRLQSNEVESLRKNKKQTSSYSNPLECPYVLTSAVKKTFEMVWMAVSQKWPVLIYGPTGAGKTALINYLAQVSRNRVLSIHMDDQMDGKTLIGNYVCTEKPGEFRWQAGSLTQAVRNGFWVVFEDIDKAPSDVQSILLPLLEGANSFVTGRGEEISVAENFRLFGTMSTFTSGSSYNSEGKSVLGVLWRSVMINLSTKEDLLHIIHKWYPNLEGVSTTLIETYEWITSSHLQQFGASQSFSRFSLRDLLKWCKRIAGLGFVHPGHGLSAHEQRTIFLEAVDIFVASFASSKDRLRIMKELAKIWRVPAVDAENSFHKPIIQELKSELHIGRATLNFTRNVIHTQKRLFVDIPSSLYVLERIACSVKHHESVLLVGETGTGKTTLVQNLANRLGQPLIVLNLSQQSDVADLLGGLKPTDPQFLCVPLYNEFMELFPRTFSKVDNPAILGYLRKHRTERNWKKILEALQRGLWKVLDLQHKAGELGSGKRKRPLGEELVKAWERFAEKLTVTCQQIDASSGIAFQYVEGAFVNALRNGHWILLDEINLAPPETLQRIMGVLEGEHGSLCLAERGDVDLIERHGDFRLFACMNPATDAGKRDLPYSVRSRFTEYFVDEILNDEDLTLFINQFLDDSCPNRELVTKIVQFYKKAKRASEERLQDGANQRPQFSLRSLYRALEYVKKAQRRFGFQKALYDGFCMFFLTLLDGPSAKDMNNMIRSELLGGTVPPDVSFDSYLNVSKSSNPDPSLADYVLTDSVKDHLRNISRAVLIRRYPILLQGPTSSGKTSLVRHLAAITGHEFVRINNHEHTDLQEYLGSYVTDATGKLVFQEGVLVKAVRSGRWIVLDELNLAPSDVLEALNRLLDDNREIFVPELQETIKAHPNFMLFATQNPPTIYGGRKMLSRAFRNRFVEIHVDEIPENELITILKERCKIPETYAKKMVDVMKDLQLHRQSSKIFAGKHGFITPRDLFRWANRYHELGQSREDLVKDGYYLLAERLRDENEKEVVRKVLEKNFSSVKVDYADLYKERGNDYTACNGSGVLKEHGNVIWTTSMQRLYFLVERCYKLREPVLLIGETAGGKTTVCQLLSAVLRRKLHILNCHQFTETSDFLGGFYPVRDRSALTMDFKDVVEQLKLSCVIQGFPNVVTLSSDISEASLTLSQLNDITNYYQRGQLLQTDVTKDDLDRFEQMRLKLIQLHQRWQTIFIWHDGPLVQAMKNGDLFLVDEISLADDSVLERLNSVLEPERKLSLAEKGGSMLENIIAHPNFLLLATMNPGGDYGKKELSPALRNRFTEIWVPPVSDSKELQSIALSCAGKSFSYAVDPMLKFWKWFSQLHTSRMLTVRDLLSWVDFMNATEKMFKSPDYAFLHGAFLVLLDGLSLGTGISKRAARKLREQCLSFLLQCLEVSFSSEEMELHKLETFGWGDLGKSIYDVSDKIVQSDQFFGITPFYIKRGDDDCEPDGFEFLSPTTCTNAMRVLRAMQLTKPVLLEGSPGVGKTSLIVALGKFSGHRVVRINLSEQTDIMDLLGSDLPVDDTDGMKFAWSDGILLQALKNGDWVLLDELNLAPQSVLEGLNAILDHRAEVFIPELGHKYKCPPSFRVFACQNPSCQGGGRKGLPKSFLNRFTKVYVDELVEDDYLYICSSLHPSIPKSLLSKLILFNSKLFEDTMISRKYGLDGSPWEFNLRDVLRSCEIIEGAPEKSKKDCFLNIVYLQRMRTAADRQEVIKLYEEVFDVNLFLNPYPRIHVNPQYLIVGNTCIERNKFQAQPSQISKSLLNILPGIRQSLEVVAHCVKQQWLCILVGPSASGKTSAVRLLAHLTGNVLNEINLSSATDISELLGCFEQYNAFRNFRSAISQVEKYINEYFSVSLESSAEALVHERKDLVSKWFKFTSSSASAHAESWSGTYDSLGLLIQIIEELKHGLEQYELPVAWSSSDLNELLKTVTKLLEYTKQHYFPAKFEWVTGILIKAIECGEWIVLENANLCNPTVLDRINSLVEPSGSITVNECGLVNGRPVVVIPNKKFRLFLTVNPRYGEVSRAMRNRGVEVFMMQPDWITDRKDGFECEETGMNDVKRFLVLLGLPLSVLVDMMAEAHMFARNSGVDLGIQITLVELTRWVQLFQQLLLNGNRALWSLHVSWEHTYLSSLGDSGGKSAVIYAKNSILSASKLSKLDAFLSHSLSLPGGWPTPFRLRNFVWHSRESCVKQNCMYLEFLGAQCASYESSGAHVRRSSTKHSSITDIGDGSTSLLNMSHKNPSLISLKRLLQMLFPTTSYEQSSGCSVLSRFDPTVFNKMIWFAANWTIEQACESDFNLYLLWFNHYSSQLHPYCHFLKSYLRILKEELDHPIWNCIFDSRRELISHYKIDVDMHPLPVLSLKLLDLIESDGCLQRFKNRLWHSVRCIDLLRSSIQQWNAEDEYNSLEDNHFSPVLESVRVLEKKVLYKLVESLEEEVLDKLVVIYSKVIEDHSLLWNGIISSKYESMIICWRTLKKDVRHLQSFFPEAVQSLLVQSTKLIDLEPWISQSSKSLLWAYGGHPLLPSSAEAYSKMQQLLSFSQLVWPEDAISQKMSSSGNYVPSEVIVSTNTELRLLAMQGIGMSSFLTIKDDQDETSMVQQLEDMHQILLRRFEHEKQNVSSPQSFMVNDVTECCVFCPEKSHMLSLNSWKELFCLFDSTSFFLDMGLLNELSGAVLVEKKQLYKVLSNNADLLATTLSFSLKFSSRSPMDFVPHQTLLWALDAFESVDSVNSKIASSVLEMWFRWHSLLWKRYTEPFKVDDGNSPLPYMLFQPARAATLDRILKSAFPIKEFDEQRLKLRIASGNLWHNYPLKRDLSDMLLSSARSLFEQIIYAHEKSFDEEKYAEIKLIFGSIQGCDNKDEQLQSLISLISSSSHSILTSLKDSVVAPLLKKLYLQSSENFLENIGCAWLHIGSLRFHLLLTPGDLDPAVKYTIRHSQIVERISVLQLEIKVREECESLVGRSSSNDMLKQRTHLLDKLDAERKRLKRKVVYREDASLFTRLKSECAEFVRLTAYSSELAMNMTAMSISELVSKAFNWQETASSFIYRLSEEYAAYADITQPVQVAVYEMKLGLSLVVSSALQNAFLAKMEGVPTERIMETIYGFIQFPRCFSLPFINNETSNRCPDYLLFHQDISCGSLAIDIKLLERLCTISRDSISDKMLSVPQSQATLCHNIFVRLTHEVLNSKLLGHKTFKILNQIFDKFAGLWMSMKIQTKEKEYNEARNYIFKTRQFKLEDILEVDVSSLKNCFTDDHLCIEWQEMMQENESTTWAAPMEHENLAEEWGLIQECVLDSMVLIHNRFFACCNTVQHPGFNQISDAEKFSSFRESYKLGLAMLKVVPALSSSSMDTKLVPEHLLSLCLDYEEKFGQLHRRGMIYNIYKDSNAPLMSKMLGPLVGLQHRVMSLLNDWPDHPGLQNILSVVEMLLGIPLNTPLAKVLSGLQFLLTKTHQLEENAPKLSISEQMQPILVLVATWLKMELESWPALLDGVQEQYEINSRKLWFPLYSVLYRGQTTDISKDIQSSIQSLEEFLQTSSIGEYKSRLQLLLAFHGQIKTGLKFYSCPTLVEYMEDTENMKDMENLKKHMEDMVKVLYNVFGYYVQFLPSVMEHIEAIRKSISADLREIVKLYNWERADNHLLMETTKRIRQKLKKHIQKFNDVLQQPVMVVLNKEAAKGGTTVQSPLEKKVSTDINDKSSMLSPISVDLETERLILHSDWRKKIDFAMEYWSPENISSLNLQYLCLKDAQETEGCIRHSLNSQSACPIFSEEWKELWILIEKIYRTITECADLWEIEKKNFGKRRAFTDLLKLLESCGLSRHKSIVSEDILSSSQPSSWFFQPSYNVQHLLLPPIGVSAIHDLTSSSQFQLPHNENCDSDWKVANEYYFRSMARVQLLRQICLNFHKDFSLDQVTRSASFLEHLILMQQEQRSFAYTFSEELMGLKNFVNLLEDLHAKPSLIDYVPNSESFVALKQADTRKCMWHQKKLFDDLCSISLDTSLLLRSVEVAHLKTCQTVKVASDSLLAFIELFIPKLQKSKELLDKYLLGTGRIFTTTETLFQPFIVSKEMEELVTQNFQVISDLEEYILEFSKQDRRSVKDILIGRFIDVLNQGKATMQESFSDLVPRNQAVCSSSNLLSLDPEAEFTKSFNKTVELLREVFRKLGFSNGDANREDFLLANITQWKVLAETYQANINLELISRQLGETITSAVHLIDYVGGRSPNICGQIQSHLNFLKVLLDPILTLGNGFLVEFLFMSRAVGKMTHMLANVLASLFSKGFGTTSEDQADDTRGDISQDASGTGMGEGAGVKDVSDQIEDEDQLLGASEKPDEGIDTSKEPPGKQEKGIEMDQDFDADTFSVSEDSGEDDNEDSGSEKLESAMGDTGDNNEVVDEKLWNKDDEENPDTKNEKHESGPSVTDFDSSSRELRAKEDNDPALHESDIDADKSDKDTRKDGEQNVPEQEEDMDDMKLDKEAPYEDPTDIQMDDQNQFTEENTDMEGLEETDDTTQEAEGSDPSEEIGAEDHNGTGEDENVEDGETIQLNQDTENTESGKEDGNVDGDDAEDHDMVPDMELSASSKNVFDQGESSFDGNSVPSAKCGKQSNSDARASEPNDTTFTAQKCTSEDMQNGLAPSVGLPSSSTAETQLAIPDSVKGGKLTADEPEAPSSPHDNSSAQTNNPNPYRSVGDALEKWKERVKVSIDAQESKTEVHDEMEDCDADEYGFVPESEKGTSQALGPATSEQIDSNVKGINLDAEEDHTEPRDDVSEMNVDGNDAEALDSRSHSASVQKLDDQMQNSALKDKIPVDEVQESGGSGAGKSETDDDSGIISRNFVTIKKSIMDEEILQLSNLTMDDDELGKAKGLETSGDDEGDAATLWRRYEQLTTRLSQELAEQLRLVMEPTVASKLQGDYKTGKRINMKKVIAYLASHYRKDKIWLRRTRPNKRDYQVVVAVDDSQSMSESNCGGVAIEALVTVCRAMSQLEVAQLAVASFGTKGNIRLLHDFNQQFTTEAGKKMISSLTFKQENTIEDAPMMDLLQYLSSMLDSAGVHSRLPSGQSPLQQLVLIISDGFLHEKEKLKRYVRDLLSKNRMVAFVIVDNPHRSITELEDMSFPGGKLTRSKYLNSFPFPYYIVLKDIEALPRTLADLLRQWFELMQNTRD